jgi:hypothetical protein
MPLLSEAIFMKIVHLAGFAPLVVGLSLAGPALAQTSLKEIPADKAKVTGGINIEFNSRSERSQNTLDVYEISNLAVADLMVLNGTVQRIPEKQLIYSIKFDVINPANPGQVAKDAAIMRGELGIDAKGVYTPDPGQLRIEVVKGAQSVNKFSGAIQGREVARWWNLSAKLKTAAKEATKVYSRYVNGQVVNIQVKNPDPLRFEGLGLASGPFSFLTETKVNGTLDFDYELGNWLTDQAGVTFTYTIGDKVYSDKVTGTIRFAEEEGSFTDAKGKKLPFTGYSEYNLRFNEPPVNRDQGLFGGDTTQADTDAFFSASDTSKPGIYGRVYFNDSETGCKKANDAEGKPKCVGPTRSEITYDLKPVGLTYQQLANWMKLELLVIGPFTDE